MPNYEYIRTDNFLDLPTTATITMTNEHQPKSMNDEYNEIRKECIQRSFKSTQSSSIKSSSATSSSNANATNLQSQQQQASMSMGSSNTTQRRRRSVDDNNITNHSTLSSNTNNRLTKQARSRRHSISNNTSINNNSFVNSSQISNILQEHLLQHKQHSSAVYNTKTTPQTVHDANNLELQHRNRRDSSTSPLPPSSELQRHLQRSSVAQRSINRQAGSSSRHTRGSLRDSNATILHSNQKRRHHQGGTLRDSSATILHSNQQKETLPNSSQLGKSGSRSRPKELVDSLQYSLDDSGKYNITALRISYI